MLSHEKAGFEPRRWAYATLQKTTRSRRVRFYHGRVVAPILVIRSSRSASIFSMLRDGAPFMARWSRQQGRPKQQGDQKLPAKRDHQQPAHAGGAGMARQP